MCLICDDDDTSYHDDPGHDSFSVRDCTGSDATCTVTDHTPWWARADQDNHA
jgi:hypothetical protein